MLVMVVSLFALLWLPYRSMLVYNSFAQTAKDKYMDLWFLMFAKTCVYINRLALLTRTICAMTGHQCRENEDVHSCLSCTYQD